MTDYLRSDAYLSPCDQYRYWLLRIWDQSLPVMVSWGVNPSTADHRVDDPTIRKDIGFAKVHNHGGLLKFNVGAYRATDPRAWRTALDPIGPENTPEQMLAWMHGFDLEIGFWVAAWGSNGRYAAEQCQRITDRIPYLWCFGRNSDGTPRHTLMLPYSTPIEPFNHWIEN